MVDGDDAGAGVAEEGAVGEDEAEGGEVFDEGAGLRAEDVARYAAAVEAEDAGEVEGLGFGEGGVATGDGDGDVHLEGDGERRGVLLKRETFL